VLFVFGNINRPEKPTRGHLTKVPFGVGWYVYYKHMAVTKITLQHCSYHHYVRWDFLKFCIWKHLALLKPLSRYLFTKNLTTKIKFLKHCNAFIILPSPIQSDQN
jgi:hypothetical protein